MGDPPNELDRLMSARYSLGRRERRRMRVLIDEENRNVPRCLMKEDGAGWACKRCGVSWVKPANRPACYRDSAPEKEKDEAHGTAF